MFSVHHPAWVYQFRHIIEGINAQSGEVRTLAVDKDGDTLLLKSYGIPYILCAGSTGINVLQKGILFIGLCIRFTWEALRWKPDIMIGRASPMIAVAAWATRKPHLLYEDTEVSKFSLKVCKRLSTKILTPRTFLSSLGPKQERVDTYKELFYLHPDVFTPDRKTLRDVGFPVDEPYLLLRFVAWNASHDIGKRGLNEMEKIALVRRFQKFCRVYVSDENALTDALKPYALEIPYHLIHHVLAFARLVYSEGATMASEAAVLGTHALYVNTIVSGTTQELSDRYGLMASFNDGENRYNLAAQKAEEWLADPGLEAQGQEKRARLLSEKVDINEYFIAEAHRLAKAGRRGASC